MGLNATTNFAKGTLATGIDATQTNLTLDTGQGALFPAAQPGGTLPFWAIIYNQTDYTDPSDDPGVEVIECTERNTDACATIERGVDGTSGSAHNTAGKTYGFRLTINQALIDQINARLTDLKQGYAADSGAADAYVITLDPAPTAYAAGQTFRFKVDTGNTSTGASTININGLGAATLTHQAGGGIAAGDLIAGSIYAITYDGSDFQVQGELLTPVQVQDQAYIYAADTGAADAYEIAPTPAMSGYRAGQRFSFLTSNANTAASTLDVSGLGVKNIKRQDGTDPAAGEIPAGVSDVMYDGTSFILMGTSQDLRGVCRAWVEFEMTGTHEINDSYNCTSLTDLGVGHTSIAWAITMANVFYAAICGSGQVNVFTLASVKATTTTTVVAQVASTLAAVDTTSNQVAIFGDI